MAKDVSLLAKAGVYFGQHDVSVQKEKNNIGCWKPRFPGSAIFAISCGIMSSSVGDINMV